MIFGRDICRAMLLDLSRRVEALLQIELTPNFSNVGRKYMLFQWTKKLTSEREKRIFKRDLLEFSNGIIINNRRKEVNQSGSAQFAKE